MISRIHSKLGTAGLVVAIVALVAALGGGAYAAQQGLNGKQKKEVKKIAKKFAGAPGPAGPQGLKGDTGATGPAGKDGANGKDGTNGTDGTDGEPGMCSAEEPECSLAPGGVLTGVWSVTGNEHVSPSAISFPVRVSPAPTAILAAKVAGAPVGYELKDGSVVLYGPYPCVSGCVGSIEEQGPDKFAEALQESSEAFTAVCSGSAADPQADSGFLCIYRKDLSGLTASPAPGEPLAANTEAAHTFGITVPYEFEAAGGYVRGSWAVSG